MLRHRRSRRSRIVFAVALAVALITTELSTRFYILYLHTLEGQQPRPDELTNLHMHMADFGLVYDDYHGKAYNIVNGERLVIDSPTTYDHTLWLFGNSTTFDYYTADAETMASRLQALLNAHGYRWRVRNLGMTAMRASGEFARLRNTGVRSGDTVIFLDGWMDSWFDRDRCDDQPLALLNALCRAVGASLHLQSDPALYWRSISNARSYSLKAGATFYHFVQPVRDGYMIAPSFIMLPDSAYVDEIHLNDDGDALLARQIFDALTLL